MVGLWGQLLASREQSTGGGFISHTAGKHSLDIVGNVTEYGPITLLVTGLRRQRLDLHALNNGFMDLRLGLVEDRTMSKDVSSISSFLPSSVEFFQGSKNDIPQSPNGYLGCRIGGHLQ